MRSVARNGRSGRARNLDLRRQGWAVGQLARKSGLSRTTVYEELASAGPRRHGPRERPAALNEAQLVHVEHRLTVCPGIRGTDLHAELHAGHGCSGGYSAFQRQRRLLRPAVVRNPRYRTYFTSAADMVAALKSAHLEGNAQHRLRTYTGLSVVVIDELGDLPLDQGSTNWIFRGRQPLLQEGLGHPLSPTGASPTGVRFSPTRSSPPPSSTGSSTARPCSTCVAMATACEPTRTGQRARTGDESESPFGFGTR